MNICPLKQIQVATGQHTDSTAATAHIGMHRDVAGGVKRHEKNATLAIR